MFWNKNKTMELEWNYWLEFVVEIMAMLQLFGFQMNCWKNMNYIDEKTHSQKWIFENLSEYFNAKLKLTFKTWKAKLLSKNWNWKFKKNLHKSVQNRILKIQKIFKSPLYNSNSKMKIHFPILNISVMHSNHKPN